jgi:hypothetical protein
MKCRYHVTESFILILSRASRCVVPEKVQLTIVIKINCARTIDLKVESVAVSHISVKALKNLQGGWIIAIVSLGK